MYMYIRTLYMCIHVFSLVHIDYSDKVNYAQKMAKGYLRSVGSGEYTPQKDSYTKDPQKDSYTKDPPDTPSDNTKPTKWKRNDSDEFDF